MYTYLVIIELRFDAMLYSDLSNENFDADRIKYSREPQAPQPRVKCCSFFNQEILFVSSEGA